MYTCWHSNLAQLCTSNLCLAQPYELSMALTIKRTHTHNLNGHTAHAASKASRSQAYTLPLVALLSLLSASPTSSTPSPQFPSYCILVIKKGTGMGARALSDFSL